MNITIPVNRKRFPIVFVISLVLTVGGAFNITRIIHEGKEQLSYWTYVVLLIPLFYCIISFIEFIKTRYDRNASLIISEKSITDNLSIFSCGEIPWNDVSTAEILRAFNANFLVVKLTSSEKYLVNKNLIQRYVLRRFVKKWQSPVIISEKRIDFDLEKLRQIILTYKTM